MHGSMIHGSIHTLGLHNDTERLLVNKLARHEYLTGGMPFITLYLTYTTVIVVCDALLLCEDVQSAVLPEASLL
jgi:hypothetical protein